MLKRRKIGEIVYDEDSFDFVLEILGDPTASCPQFDEILGCVPKLCKTIL